MMRTHYQALGVGEQATADEIRRAYRRLVLRTHPDRTTDPQAHQQFLVVNEAYDVLSNPTRRQGYDALLWATRNPPRRAVLASPLPPVSPRPQARAPFQRQRATAIDFRPYQAPIRLWGKVLLLLAVLVVLDYYGFQHEATATFTSGAVVYDARDDIYTIVTSEGRFRTPQELTTSPLYVHVSRLFGFIRSARLPDGTEVAVLFRYHTLFVLTGLLLLLAGLTQGQLLSDAARVNVALIATVVGALVAIIVL
ncbi:J domain-containing protein [Hymenobacter elongatus]|uniref:J domain-containing protein n=1 Tax=Hymenobacter elongatus TaxID=877208 RepID=A0A4Z0PMV0_9BACT|nr:J domain-containing protein [Hymenobacter elongatus]TGE17813.1 hypothetical protein E5J99_06370 [Hymenobacter elongatus]